jgi:hypothetical protein
MGCFKFDNMRGVFKNIYEYLHLIAKRMDELDGKIGDIRIPDISELRELIMINKKKIESLNV